MKEENKLNFLKPVQYQPKPKSIEDILPKDLKNNEIKN